VTVRENVSSGYLLSNYDDYSIQTSTSQSVIVTRLSGTVPTAGWAVMISSAGPTSAFQAHTHTIQQIETLQDTLNSLGQRLGTLENVLPNNPGLVNQPDVSTTPLTIKINEHSEVLFAEDVENAWGKDGINLEVLPERGPSLLRSISGLAVNATTAGVPTAAGAYIYSAGIQLPPMGYVPGRTVRPGGVVAFDEGRIYEVRQDGTNSTFYPVDYEVELFKVAVNPNQLRVGRTLTVEFGVVLQMLADTDGQWRMVVDAANLAGLTSPATQGLNISSANYNQNKLIDHRMLLTGALTPHIFGVQILRRLDGEEVVITANKNLYGTYESTIGAPATADFLLRARLMHFDVSNEGGDPRGWVGYKFGAKGEQGIGGTVEVKFS
jgi:hypothetical protein